MVDRAPAIEVDPVRVSFTLTRDMAVLLKVGGVHKIHATIAAAIKQSMQSCSSKLGRLTFSRFDENELGAEVAAIFHERALAVVNRRASSRLVVTKSTHDALWLRLFRLEGWLKTPVVEMVAALDGIHKSS